MTDFKAYLSRHESFKICRRAANLTIERLAKNKGRAAQGILERLKSCRKGSRCFSGVCPVCARQYRLRLLPQAEHILGEDGPWVQLWWTPPSALVAKGLLVDFDLGKLLDHQKQFLLEAIPGTVAIGGIDVSLGIRNRAAALWRISSCVLISGPITQGNFDRITHIYQTGRSFCRSFSINPVLHKPHMLSYDFKHRIFARSYDHDMPSNKRPKFNVLHPSFADEADLFQERWPLWDRLLLHNVSAGKVPHRPMLRRLI